MAIDAGNSVSLARGATQIKHSLCGLQFVRHSAAFGTHDHTVDVLASFKVYNGPNLAWFLNAGNPTINSVTFPPQNTFLAEDHTHAVFLLPVVPSTAAIIVGATKRF